MHPDTQNAAAGLFRNILSVFERLGLSKRSAQRRRALSDLRYASEYFKYDIGFYEQLLNSAHEGAAGHLAVAPSPVARNSALEQPDLLSCRQA